MDEKIKAENSDISYRYSHGKEYGLSIGYQIYSSSLNGRVMPEVFYRNSYAGQNDGEEDHVGYDNQRSGIQLVLEKEIFKKNCKMTIGFAKDSTTGDITSNKKNEVYAKGKCYF